ncbi:hypothetical protein GCM10009850_076190 [Nonomuraea monospora]|uniref:Uncharacterized protein n=1 Tax=Nonomuraea monospora TaxID=568818 RepID=A0ABN3CRR8_9ACTN
MRTRPAARRERARTARRRARSYRRTLTRLRTERGDGVLPADLTAAVFTTAWENAAARTWNPPPLRDKTLLALASVGNDNGFHCRVPLHGLVV